MFLYVFAQNSERQKKDMLNITFDLRLLAAYSNQFEGLKVESTCVLYEHVCLLGIGKPVGFHQLVLMQEESFIGSHRSM